MDDLLLGYNKLSDLTITNQFSRVYCWGNNLNELLLPIKLVRLSCWENNISELTLNKNLTYLSCDMFVDVNNINNKELSIFYHHR